ncbi:MAG TPA: hypothetical protein VFB54_10380 [Burkholderiales bacterium]|nr:hypothetical protein [Burkholderiales bacterium]
MNQSSENFEYPTSQSATRGNGPDTSGMASTVRDSMQQAKQKLGETMATAQERSRQVVDATSGYIQRWPFGAIAVAAGVGMVVGWLLAQPRQSNPSLRRSWW